MDSIDISLYIGYTLFLLAAGAAIIMPLINAAGNPKILVKSGIGVGVLILVFVIGYALSGNEVIPMYAERGVTSGLSKTVGGALIAFYILFIGAAIGVAYMEFSKFFK